MCIRDRLREPELGGAGAVGPGQAPGRSLRLIGDASIVLRRVGRFRRQRLANGQRPAPDDHLGHLRLPVLVIGPCRADAYGVARAT